MYDKLKNEVYKEFDKNKNYNTIISNMEEVRGIKNTKLKIVLGTICTIMIVSIIGISSVNLIKSSKPEISISNQPKWEVKKIYYDSSQVEYSMQIAVEPHWNEMSISQQFGELNYSKKIYESRNTTISFDKIGEKIGSAVLTGIDEYNNEEHSINADLYEINAISRDCAIALQFEDTAEYYVYINAYYKPSTLGQFIEDLNLKDNISFGKVSYEYLDKNRNTNEQFVTVEFDDVKNEDIWQMLFSNSTLKNIYSQEGKYTSDYFVKEVGISVNIPLLGYEKDGSYIGITLTDKGYLITNILETGKGFYIGEQKVQEFINYLAENYKGYEIQYIDTNQNSDTNDQQEKDDKIMCYDAINNTETEVDMNIIRNNNSNISSTEAYDPTKNNK